MYINNTKLYVISIITDYLIKQLAANSKSS